MIHKNNTYSNYVCLFYKKYEANCKDGPTCFIRNVCWCPPSSLKVPCFLLILIIMDTTIQVIFIASFSWWTVVGVLTKYTTSNFTKRIFSSLLIKFSSLETQSYIQNQSITSSESTILYRLPCLLFYMLVRISYVALENGQPQPLKIQPF